MNADFPVFARYELLGTLGEGGFAAVYRARDRRLGRVVALKVLLPWLARDAEVCRRFEAEARALAALRHHNIVTAYDVGEENGLSFFTMELIEGQMLAQFSGGGPLALGTVRSALTGLCAALDEMHAEGIVHRDLKPSNVMLDQHGRVVLMDFGIARSLEVTQHRQTGAMLGTPQFMAPEQFRGEPVEPAADIYALGVLTYALLAGRRPFEGDTARVLYAQVHEPPPPLRELRPGLPEPVYAAVEAALAKTPEPRPRSANAFLQAFLAPESPAELAPTVAFVSDSRPADRVLAGPAFNPVAMHVPPVLSQTTDSPASLPPPVAESAPPARPAPPMREIEPAAMRVEPSAPTQHPSLLDRLVPRLVSLPAFSLHAVSFSWQ